MRDNIENLILFSQHKKKYELFLILGAAPIIFWLKV